MSQGLSGWLPEVSLRRRVTVLVLLASILVLTPGRSTSRR